MPRGIPQAKFVRSIRHDQTFDLYAQRLENLDGAVASGRMSREEGEAKAERVLAKVKFLREAIDEIEREFVKDDIAWERSRR